MVRAVYETGNYYASLASYRKAVEAAAADEAQSSGDQDAAGGPAASAPSSTPVANSGDFNQLRPEIRAFLLQMQSDKTGAVASTTTRDSTGGQKTATDLSVSVVRPSPTLPSRTD